MKSREMLFASLAFVAGIAFGSVAPDKVEGLYGPKIAERYAVARQDRMIGFVRTVFDVDGCEAWVVEPARPAADGRWIWCMEWPAAFQIRTGVKALLDAGYRWVTFNPASKTVYAGNQNDEMIAKRRAFQKFLVDELGFAPKCGLVGMSWGGFYSVRYASTHPDCVCAAYLDAPLLDFSTLHNFNLSTGNWSRKGLSKYYPFITDDYDGADDPYQSVNRAAPIAKAGIPLLILYGAKDTTVPPEKNCIKFAAAFEKAGGDLMIERRSRYGHHPHGVEPSEVQRIVNFFDRAYAADATAALGDAIFSPAYFWMWNGKLDAAKLCAQLENMHAHGLRNVCIHPFPKGFRKWFPTEMDPDYLTDGYLDAYAKVVRRAGELGMHVYLYDEGGWPSGGACSLVADSDKEGRFMRREMALAADGSPTVSVAPYPEGVARYPSVIERGTTQRFIELTHDAYAKRLGGSVGTTVRIAFTDEPGMSRGNFGKKLAWTADFADEFRRRKGYDVMPFVPALTADEKGEGVQQVMIDVMDVRADLFVERYLEPLRAWCRQRGMMSGGHLDNDDTPEFALRQNHGSLLRSLRAMDVPGIDVIWRQLFPASGGKPAKVNPFPRYAASAMHQNGGRFALSESFAIFGDSVSPAQMKWVVDFQMVRGINTFVFGYFAQSNAKHWMTLFEPHAGPAVPFWDFQPHFFRYVERTGRFISQGRPGAETVVLLNTRAFWAGKAEAEAAAKAHYAVAGELDAMNCDYDFTEDRDVANAAVTSGGKLKIGAMEYGAVVLPSDQWMMDAAKKKIAEFKAAGGIVAHGLDLSQVPRTLRVTGDGARAIRVLKRIDGKRRIWFVVNEDMEERSVGLSFPEKGRVVRYDPEGDSFEVASGDGNVRRTFGGGEAVVYVTGDDAVKASSVPGAAASGAAAGRDLAVKTIDSGWTLKALVSHEVGASDFEVRPCSAEAKPVSLGDWRGVLGGTFSGKALYRVEFESEAGGDALLDLGEVKWCASARLNGDDLGARFFGPFRWPAKLKKGRNILEVTVANLLVNQIGDDAIRDRVLRDFQPNGRYDRFLRPFDRENRESGLFGPVTVQSRTNYAQK